MFVYTAPDPAFLPPFDAEAAITKTISETCSNIYNIPNIINSLLTLDKLLTEKLNLKEQADQETLQKELLKTLNISLLNHEKIYSATFQKVYKVYCHLKNKGFCLVSGQANGVDFLLYPDSPEKSHASHGVVVAFEERKITDYYELLMNVRNCQQVRKRFLLAFVE